MRIPGIYNTFEPFVMTELESYFQKNESEICHCPLCLSDMAAYALNRLPAKYASTSKGELHFQHEITTMFSEYIEKVVIESIEHVSKNPHRVNTTITGQTIEDLFSVMEQEAYVELATELKDSKQQLEVLKK